MPELPEVETIKRGLENYIIGKKIAKIKRSDKKLRFPFPNHFDENLIDAEIDLVFRRARYLLLKLSNKKTLLIHLGMTGRLNFIKSKSDLNHKHDHLVINFTDNTSLVYNDVRRFGFIDLILTEKLDSHKMIKNLGPEPLSSNFSSTYLSEILKNKTINIKTAMMDNKIVVGVGNIYINESLFLSKISPLTSANKLEISKIKFLVENIKKTLTKAIDLGGSSLRDYVDLKGDVGKFQFDFKVYSRHNQKCVDCFCIIKKIKQNGRSSFYCSKCQN
jgi:formamidopyrimidine-DNA glycosylase